MKDQHKHCKLAAIFVLSSSTCITHNVYFVTYICFYAEFIIQIPGKCRLRNFYLVLLLKIRTYKVTTLKYIFTCI